MPADSCDSRNHPANIAGDAGQVGNYFSEWLSENDRDADFQSMRAPELWPAFQAFIPYYDKVWSIGAPNIRPEILEKTGLELPAPAPEAAPYHFSPGGEKMCIRDRLSIKADMQAELDGGQSLGLKGTMLKAEGTQVSVSGSAMTQVSGGMVKLG